MHTKLCCSSIVWMCLQKIRFNSKKHLRINKYISQQAKSKTLRMHE